MHLTLSSNLSWEQHVNSIFKKAQGKLYFLRRRLLNAPPAVKLNTYKNLMRPSLEYADIIWSPHQKYLIGRLERIQNLAVHFVYSNYSRHSSISNLLKKADLHSLAQRRVVSRLKFLYLLYHGHFNIKKETYLQEPFYHSSRTNNTKALRQPISHINVHKYSLFPSAIHYWNKLPSTVVNCSTVEYF